MGAGNSEWLVRNQRVVFQGAEMSSASIAAASPRSWVLGLCVVLVVAAAIRFPPLLNANDINSDGAIVGVQAMKILDGELSRHLYGATYQSSSESMLAAALFLLGGPSLLKVALVPFFGMLLLLTLGYWALTRQLSPAQAVLCLLPLAIGSIAVNMPMMYIQRQVMITVLVAGVVVLHGASTRRFSSLAFFGGTLLAGLAVAIDTFALVMGPAVALFTLLCLFDDKPGWKRLLARGALAAAAAVLCLVAAKWMGHLEPSAGGLLRTNLDRNLAIFTDSALPFAFGWKVWMWSHEAPSYSKVWDVPEALRTAQMIAAFVLFALMLAAVPLAAVRRIEWKTRRLALFGVFGAVSAVGIFLFSGAPVDQWSARYLAPMLWLSPFALAAAAGLFNARGLAVLLAPWLVGATAAAWVTWGPFVDGPLPVFTDRGRAADERVLRDALRARGVRAAAADYWLAYRLSLLFELEPKVVPLSAGQDRIPEHRAIFDSAPEVALVFHPSEQRSMPQPWLDQLVGQGGTVTAENIAGFTVIFWKRR
jgi:hypothetical protein